MNDLMINPEHVSEEIITFLSQTFEREGFTKAVIAVSGGVDSATTLALTTKALGPKNIFPVFLPYGEVSKQDLVDAQSVCKSVDIPTQQWTTIDISSSVDVIVSSDNAMDAVRKGNVMARVRMIFVYDLAKRNKALVVGTENKSEHYLGYFTRFGDEASDIEPLRGLFKTQVYQLATYLQIPDAILKKAPSAGLWPGQTDEEEFGFSYKEADEVLLLYEQHTSTNEILRLKRQAKTTQHILDHIQKMKFKQQLPYKTSI